MSSGQFVVEQHRAAENLDSDSALGITRSQPKYPQYAVISTRLESFRAWPEHLYSILSPESLAEAGLVYTGVGDSVRCFYCGGGLRSWDEGDSAWEQHAKWYSHCPYVLLVKGQNYVDRVLNDETPDDATAAVKEEKVLSLEDHLQSPAAQSCIQMGHSEALVKEAIRRLLSEGMNNFIGENVWEKCEQMIASGESEMVASCSNATDSCPDANTNHATNNLPSATDTEASDRDLDSEDLQELIEENERLKENNMCKICLDDIASIIFLPCGHMVSCPQCAPALPNCPVCRDRVTGRVKAYFA